jgi:hypothetical protein
MPARKALTPVLLAAALFAAGCGGSEVAYEEVDLPPATITVPKDTGSSSSADASKTPEPTPTPTVTPDASGGTGTGAATGGTTAGGTTSGGTTAGGTTEDTGGAPTQTQTQPEDTGGASPDEGLDQFCADNPGACDGEG